MEARRLVLSEARKYLQERGEELAAQFTALIEHLSVLEDRDLVNEPLKWHQFIRRMRHWWNRDELQRAAEQVNTLRNKGFRNACALTHLFAGNISPVLELLKNDEEELLSEKRAGNSENQQYPVHGRQEKLLQVQELRQCLKSIA